MGYCAGIAKVECPDCGLCMTEESHDIGYGDTLKAIYIKVTNQWNKVMAK